MDAQTITDAQKLAENIGRLPEAEIKPVLIIISGLPGTGKTYFSKKLAEKIPLLILESDALRKILFTPPMYTVEESSRLFRAIHQLIKNLLKESVSLVLDATNISEVYRERLYNIADSLNTKLILIRVEAPPDLVRERLYKRTLLENPKEKSDADWTVYQKMKPSVEKIRRHHFAVDTSKNITSVIDRIIRESRH